MFGFHVYMQPCPAILASDYLYIYIWPMSYLITAVLYLFYMYIWEVFALHDFHLALLYPLPSSIRIYLFMFRICICLPSMHMHTFALPWLTSAYICMTTVIYDFPSVVSVCFIYIWGMFALSTALFHQITSYPHRRHFFSFLYFFFIFLCFSFVSFLCFGDSSSTSLIFLHCMKINHYSR